MRTVDFSWLALAKIPAQAKLGRDTLECSEPSDGGLPYLLTSTSR
jgi:hypothetical protein